MGRVTMMNETHDVMRWEGKQPEESEGGEWTRHCESLQWVGKISKEKKKRPNFQGKQKMSKRLKDAYAHFKQHFHLGWR